MNTQKIGNRIKENELVIVRGASGSGKSTFVNRKYPSYNHFEADMYFQKNGNYEFDRSKLHEAHGWCQNEVKKSLDCGNNTIVSNTFVKLWEMQYYLDLGKIYNIPVTVYRLTTKFKNIHNVPDEIVNKMVNGFEDYNGEIIIGGIK